MCEEDKNFILRWISEIAPKLAKTISFKEWIKGFESRYPADLLREMEQIWNQSYDS